MHTSVSVRVLTRQRFSGLWGTSASQNYMRDIAVYSRSVAITDASSLFLHQRLHAERRYWDAYFMLQVTKYSTVSRKRKGSYAASE